MSTNGNGNGNHAPPSLASLATKPKQKRKYTRRQQQPAGGFKIDDGIEMPPAQPKSKYPWDQLEVKQSFFVPNAPQSLVGSISKRNKDGPKEFAVRKWKEGTVTGVRIWRTK